MVKMYNELYLQCSCELFGQKGLNPHSFSLILKEQCDQGLSDLSFKVNKGAKNRNRYNQVPHLTQEIIRKVIQVVLLLSVLKEILQGSSFS